MKCLCEFFLYYSSLSKSLCFLSSEYSSIFDLRIVSSSFLSVSGMVVENSVIRPSFLLSSTRYSIPKTSSLIQLQEITSSHKMVRSKRIIPLDLNSGTAFKVQVKIPKQIIERPDVTRIPVMTSSVSTAVL